MKTRPHSDVCPRCGGSGRSPLSVKGDLFPCSPCNGSGRVAAPELAGAADLEYQTRLDADRVTAEFAAPRQPAKPQHAIEDLPLFNAEGERQGGLFE